jgi:hypothetical protein
VEHARGLLSTARVPARRNPDQDQHHLRQFAQPEHDEQNRQDRHGRNHADHRDERGERRADERQDPDRNPEHQADERRKP